MTTLLADVYVHTLDPFAIRFTETIGVRWYGLSYLAGFVIAWLLIWWMARTDRSPLPAQRVGDLMFYAIVGVLVGGRLGYVFFYDPSLLVEFTARVPWWGILAIHRGGMASHGGMIGAIVAMLLFALRHRIPALHLLDLGAFVAPPGLFLGRIANFISGELIGRPVPDQENPPSWSMKFPQEMRHWDTAELAQVRPIADLVIDHRDWDLAIADIAAQPQAPPPDAINTIHYTIERLIELAQAGNETVIEHMRQMLTAVYPSQLIQAATEGPILFAVLALIWLRPRKPGVIAGAFLMTYGVLRIISENFREPDASMVLELTRGQTLSILMVVAGAALAWWSARRAAPSMGGMIKR